MRSQGINGEGELRGQPANPGSPGKMAVKMECVCVCSMQPTQKHEMLTTTSLFAFNMSRVVAGMAYGL